MYHILKYSRFETSRSSGPGGQHVNKTESKVTIFFNINDSDFTEIQKDILRSKFANKINEAGELYMQSMASRSQHANKEAVLLKVATLIEQALLPVKKRIKSVPTKSSVQKRLETKKKISEKKNWRKGLDL